MVVAKGRGDLPEAIRVWQFQYKLTIARRSQDVHFGEEWLTVHDEKGKRLGWYSPEEADCHAQPICRKTQQQKAKAQLEQFGISGIALPGTRNAPAGAAGGHDPESSEASEKLPYTHEQVAEILAQQCQRADEVARRKAEENAREQERVLRAKTDTGKPEGEAAPNDGVPSDPQGMARPGPWAETFTNMSGYSNLKLHSLESQPPTQGHAVQPASNAASEHGWLS